MLDIFYDDLLEQGRGISPRALEFLLEPEGVKLRAGEPPAYRRTYVYAERFGRLPRNPRIEFLRSKYPLTVRGLEIRLWDVLENEPSLDGKALATVFATLPAEIVGTTLRNDSERSWYDDNFDLDWPPRRRLGPTLSALDDIGGVDAFTSELILLKRRLEDNETLLRTGLSLETMSAREAVAHMTFRISLSLFSTFCRLVVFPPFFAVRHELYDYLAEHYLKYSIEYPPFGAPPFSREAVDHIATLGRRVLTAAAALGLVGPSFQEQHDLLVKFESYERSDCLDQLERAAKSITITEIAMTEPLFDLVQELRHPRIPPTHPLILPVPIDGRKSRRLANALGPIEYRQSPRSPPQGKRSRKRPSSVKWSA